MIKKSTGWKQSEMKSTHIPGKFNKKPCKYCGNEYEPVAPSHLYCSDRCKDRGLADNYYRNQYNITLFDVELQLEKQEWVCAICQEEGFKMNEHVHSPLNVDHCHVKGTFRGLLCHNCNRALGLFKDNIDRLKRAINYLEGATTIP